MRKSLTEVDRVKRFFNIFYTTHVKITLALILIICSWFMNSELTNFLHLYRQDRAALINVFMQGDDYDYKSSYFLTDAIETAISDVMEYSLVYNRKADFPYPEYGATATEEYNTLIERIQSYKSFRFAVVNHKTNIIISNIASLNGKGPEITVRRYFGEDKNLLIIRDVKNPFFENGPLIEYVDYASELATKYTDDFDIYLSFGDSLEFTGSSEYFSQKHDEALMQTKNVFKSIFAYLIALLIITLMLICVSGQKEAGGKIYRTLSDRLPNDLTFLLCFIMYISMSALYENSLYMALRSANNEDYWMQLTPEFYLIRSNISMVLMISLISFCLCALKRHIRCRTLMSNTYILKLINNFKKAEPLE